MKELKPLIKHDYENKGLTIKEIAKKYDVKEGTIKSWSNREKWNKKKVKVATSDATSKKMQPKKKKVAVKRNPKKIEVQKDILLGVEKEEILEKYGIKKSAYYSYREEIEELILYSSQRMLNEAVEFAYFDREELIKRLFGEKRNILVKSIPLIKSNMLSKDIQIGISKAIENINEVLKSIMKDIGIVNYEDLIKYAPKKEEIKAKTKLTDLLNVVDAEVEE